MTQRQKARNVQALLRQLPVPAGDPFAALLAKLDMAEQRRKASGSTC